MNCAQIKNENQDIACPSALPRHCELGEYASTLAALREYFSMLLNTKSYCRNYKKLSFHLEGLEGCPTGYEMI